MSDTNDLKLAEDALLRQLKQAEELGVRPPGEKERREAHAQARAHDELPANRVTITQVRRNPYVIAYLEAANEQLRLQGFTEHGLRHAGLVSHIAGNVIERLGLPQRQTELAEIAGYLHDIGNVINREMHGQIGALLAREILLPMGMPIDELVLVMGAIGNHEEERGHAISPIAAALILADKADVHRSRVQSPETIMTDIHDRVNYAATRSFLRVVPETQKIVLEVTIDTAITPIMDFFEIYLSRMIMCRRAAEFLGCSFSIEINGLPLL